MDFLARYAKIYTNENFPLYGSLKPSLIVSTFLADEYVISQHKQLFVKLKPSVYYSTSPSHCVSWLSHSISLSLSLSHPLSSSLSPSYLFLSPSVHEYNAWKHMHIKLV